MLQPLWFLSLMMSSQYLYESHYNDVIMSAMSSKINSLTIVYSTVYSMRRSKKKSKLRVTGLCAWNSPVTGEFPAQRPVTRKMFPFDDVIMICPQSGRLLVWRWAGPWAGPSDWQQLWSGCCSGADFRIPNGDLLGPAAVIYPDSYTTTCVINWTKSKWFAWRK